MAPRGRDTDINSHKTVRTQLQIKLSNQLSLHQQDD